MSQLFAQYLNGLNSDSPSEDEEYVTLDLILNKTSCETCMFPILKPYLADFFPFKQIDALYNILIDDIKAYGRINFLTTLSHNDNKFKNDLLELYNQGKSSVEVKIKKEAIIRYFSDSYVDAVDSIKFNINLKEKSHYLPKNVFNYIPINPKGISCNIIFNNESVEVNLEPSLLFNVKSTKGAQRSSNKKQKKLRQFIKKANKTFDVELFLGEKFNFKDFKPKSNLDDKPKVVSDNFYPNNSNYKIIPVGANWTENRHIVGYFNVITNEYNETPAYELIKQANDYNGPHFLILDEMNLSHVERYFADFLSAIESGENIPLYGEEELSLPSNLFIIGTVNVDETTYMFSPKVLDRANVIEFETNSAFNYMNNKINLDAPKGDISYLENPLEGSYIRELGIEELRELFKDVKVEQKPFWNILSDEIYSFQTILVKSGFDFGFRVINEIVRFMAVAWEYEGKPKEFANWTRYFDACIKQKILPKLHGSEKIIGETLDELYAKCLGNSFDSAEMAKYPKSYKKLKEMREVLRNQRYVSFIN